MICTRSYLNVLLKLLKIRIRHIHDLKWEQRFCEVTVQFIRVVILKILPFRLQTVLNEQPSSRQYQKERKNLRLLLLPEVMTI